MKKILYITLTTILFYISGCSLGPDFQKQEYKGPETFRFDRVKTDSLVNLKWWELFNDSVLDTCIRIALKENKDVLIAAARIEAARANVGYTKANALPSAGLNIGAGRGNFAGAKTNTASNFYAYPDLIWEIDFWGKYRRATESARAEMLATTYGMRTIQISLITAVAQTYYLLLDYKARLDITTKTLASRDKGLNIIQSRFDEGIVAEIDLNQAQIQRAIAAAAVPLYQRYIAITESSLGILLGRTPAAVVTGDILQESVAPPVIPVGLPSEIMQRRPDIAQAEQNYAAQLAYIGVAEAMRWPSISLTGLLGVASNDLSTLTTGGLAWSMSANLLGPLFHFGKNKRNVEIQQYKTEAALQEYEKTVLQAFKEVEDALISIETIKKELEFRKLQYKAAINAEYLSGQRYYKGVTSYLEVLETQRQSFDAQLLYSQTLQELFSSYIALYKALGGGWLSENEEKNSQ